MKDDQVPVTQEDNTLTVLLTEWLIKHDRFDEDNDAIADAEDAYCDHFGALYCDEDAHCLVDAYPAHHDPDCTVDDDGGTKWSWTPLGLEVKAILESE